jgi:geranylgeranyl diphosphate synthase type I
MPSGRATRTTSASEDRGPDGPSGWRAQGGVDPEKLLRRYREATLAEMKAVLAGRRLPLYDMMHYHLGSAGPEGRPAAARAGKMLRPALCLLSCEAVGGRRRQAAPAAAAIELLHNFTLIHDDIEDASESRHGRDTVWRVWGEAQAINAGDGMFALAHLTLHRLFEAGVAASQVLEAARLLDEASLALCEGQHLDLEFEKRLEVTSDDYLAMISGKTAALIGAATAVGALLGGASEDTVSAFKEFGRCLGLAFQIYDDVLGIWGDPVEMGKPAGDDITARKKSFPVVYALGHASENDRRSLRRVYGAGGVAAEGVAEVIAVLERSGAHVASEETAARHVEGALACLQGLDLAPARRRELEALALYLVHRCR